MTAAPAPTAYDRLLTHCAECRDCRAGKPCPQADRLLRAWKLALRTAGAS